MWIWRRMEKVSWTEHMTNEEVLQRVEEKRSLITTLKDKRTGLDIYFEEIPS